MMMSGDERPAVRKLAESDIVWPARFISSVSDADETRFCIVVQVWSGQWRLFMHKPDADGQETRFAIVRCSCNFPIMLTNSCAISDCMRFHIL